MKKVEFVLLRQWIRGMICLSLCLTSQWAAAQSYSHNPFVIKVDTRGAFTGLQANPDDDFIKIGIYQDWTNNGGTFAAFGIDWENDGTIDQDVDFGVIGGSSTFARYEHTYDAPGEYEIAIYAATGAVLWFSADASRNKMMSVESWGDMGWYAFDFGNCVNMTSIDEENAPNLTNCSSMERMFLGCRKLEVTSLNHWDVSSVENMREMFYQCWAFNGEISLWDVSNVTDMKDMFREAKVFNQDISGWDVSNVTTMWSMFQDAEAFNQDISGWDVSNVTNLTFTFLRARAFNQDLSGWDVSNCTNFSSIFSGAVAFDQNLGSWDISNAESMGSMFDHATGISVENYDATLIGWAALPNPPSGVSFCNNGIKYCESGQARQKLTEDYGWTFSCDTKMCPPLPPVASCKDANANVGPGCGPAQPDAAIFDNNSTDPNPEDVGQLSFGFLSDASFELGEHSVEIVVTDPSGLKDTCSALLTVVDSMTIQPPFEALDLGDQGAAGSTYTQEVCDTKAITISTGAVMSTGSTSDNMATLTQELCGANSYIAAKINEVSGGYAGVFLRSGTNEDDAVAGIFKGEGIVHQSLVRSTDGASADLTFLLPDIPSQTGWVGILRQGNNLRFYTSKNGSNWRKIGAPVYLPGECLEAGVAVYSTGGTANTLIRRVKLGENYGGESLSGTTVSGMESGIFSQAGLELDGNIFPNPATGMAVLAFNRPLDQSGLIKVCNALGQEMLKVQVGEGELEAQLPVAGLPAGHYFVQVQAGAYMQVLPLIKQ
jgi:surface protein